MSNLNEEEIEIFKNLIEYMQNMINNGYHKFIYNDLDWDFKCIDCINALNKAMELQNELNKEKEKNNKIKEKIDKEMKYLWVDSCAEDSGKYSAYKDVLNILEDIEMF